jgi:hypothetical protein
MVTGDGVVPVRRGSLDPSRLASPERQLSIPPPPEM